MEENRALGKAENSANGGFETLGKPGWNGACVTLYGPFGERPLPYKEFESLKGLRRRRRSGGLKMGWCGIDRLRRGLRSRFEGRWIREGDRVGR